MNARYAAGRFLLMALSLLPAACEKAPVDDGPVILAHKGLVDLAPENSLAAIREALKAGADGCELDVQVAKTGEVIVLHDPVVNRVSDGEGWVKDLTLERIKSLRLDPDPAGRYKDEKIPTLGEVFETFGKEAVFFIEMKRPGGMKEAHDGMEEKVGALIDRYGLFDTTFVSSFNPKALADLKRAYPRVRTVYEYHQGTTEGLPRPAFLEAAGDIYALGPSIKILTPALAEWARAQGYRLSTFSPSTLDEMERAAALGCDLVTTVKPELYRMVLQGALKPEGLEKIPPQFQQKAAKTVSIQDAGGAYLDLPAEPEALYLILFRFKCEGEKKDDGTDTRILLVERKDSTEAAGKLVSIEPETFTNPGGVRAHTGPSYFCSEAMRNEGGWMRVRFALRTTHRTRSFRLILGTFAFQGKILLDGVSLRKL